MSAVLPPADRRKLVGILGMLGSNAVGERASAALLATRMVKAAGLQWSDLIGSSPEQRPYQNPRRTWSEPQPPPGGNSNDLATCARHLGAVTAWEAGFVQSLQRRQKHSMKQLAILRDIAADLRKRGLQ